MTKRNDEQRAAFNAYMRRWRAEHPERRKEIDTKSKEKHKDRVRAYQREWMAVYRSKNPEKTKEIARRSAEKNRDKIRAKSKIKYYSDVDKSREEARIRYQKRADFVAAMKLASGCVDCGFKGHSAALHFDHLPQYEKKFNVGPAIRSKNNKELFEEIAKCEVRCANCHAIKTAQRRCYVDLERKVVPRFEGMIGCEIPISLLPS
jgi:5-methylcytosine-specific restriction endonuclease McrA